MRINPTQLCNLLFSIITRISVSVNEDITQFKKFYCSFSMPFSPLIPPHPPAIPTLLSMSMSPFSFLLNPSTPYPLPSLAVILLPMSSGPGDEQEVDWMQFGGSISLFSMPYTLHSSHNRLLSISQQSLLGHILS